MKGLEMNTQQIAGWLRTTLAWGGPMAVLIAHKFGLSEGEYAMYLNVFIAIVPGGIAAVWSWLRNREATQIEITKDLPTVAHVAVKDDANGKVGAMADNVEMPKVVRESEVKK